MALAIGRTLGMALAVGLAVGCVPVAPLPATSPELPLQAWEQDEAQAAKSAAPGQPPASAAPSRPSLAKTRPAPAANAGPRTANPAAGIQARPAPSSIGGGAGCLAELATRDVSFVRSEPVLGIATPVVVRGPIAGVRFYSHEKKPFVVDCRLALALHVVAEDLRALGVREVRYSGAYVYRTSRPGRMSLHAYGLAIDLHEFFAERESFLVKKAFARGRGCSGELPVLNELACRIRARGLFHEQIGPDDNAAHHDHFHLGLRPLPGEVAADLPWPSTPSPRRRATRAPRTRPGSLPEVSAPKARSPISSRDRSASARRAR